MKGYINNTTSLCFVLGWQGGTINQVAEALGVQTSDILSADETQMGDLLRRAQSRQRSLIELQHKAIFAARGDFVPNDPSHPTVRLMEAALRQYDEVSQAR